MKTYIAIIFILCTLIAESRHLSLKGTVKCSGENGRAIPGATIKVNNTMIGTYANTKGYFELKNIPESTAAISISAVGYKSKTVSLSDLPNDETIQITLEKSEVISQGVVVTANRSERIYEDVPVKVSILTDKIFESTGSMNLRDGLSFQPGLRIETNCQNCGFSEIRMNGLEGKYSQVLIDGKAIYSALNGVYGLEQIPSSMIDRVEIIRGGGSSLYGGNSIAGVINIITKTPSSSSFNASANYSSINAVSPDATIQLNGAIVNESADMGVMIFGSNRHRSEWDANNDGYTEIGRLDVKNIGGNFFYKPDHKSKLSMEYHTIFHEIRGGDGLDLPPHETNITEMTTHNTNVFQLQYEKYIGQGNQKISLYGSGQLTNRDSYYGANQDPNAYGTTDNQTYAAGLQYSSVIESFFGNHVITGGYEFNSDKMIDLAPAYSRKIDQHTLSNGIYLQDDWGITDYLYFVFGSRFDSHNLIDGLIISPRANLMVKPTQDLSVRLSYSTGYRAPQAFDEDLHITQVGGEGMIIRLSENLKPEYSVSYSFSADYSFKMFGFPFSLSNEYFYTSLKDVFILEEVGRDGEGALVIERRNGEEAEVFGTTLELMTNISDYLSFKGGITIQKAMYKNPVAWGLSNDDSELFTSNILKTPDFYGYFSAQVSIIDDLELNLSGVYTGGMYVPHFAGGIGIDGNERLSNELKFTNDFFELNTMLSYRVDNSTGIELQIGCQNLLNSFQRDFDSGIGRDAGYMYGPSRPRTVFVGIKTGF